MGFRAVGSGSAVARAGAVAIGVGATADVIENGFLIRNIAARSTLTDGWVDAMQVPGVVKWVAAPGFLVLAALLIRSKFSRHVDGAGGEA